MLRTERIDRDDENVVICPNGELLLDGITQANLEDNVIGSDIRTFYTWRHKSIPSDKAFIILQFPNNVITPTKVAVYCLRLQNLRVREPKKIRLYYSTRESIFPDRHEIQGAFAENDFVVTGSGRTSENDEYEYRRYDLIISENSRVSLNYLCIEFEFNDWIFISEVEVYHLYEQCKLTLCITYVAIGNIL